MAYASALKPIEIVFARFVSGDATKCANFSDNLIVHSEEGLHSDSLTCSRIWMDACVMLQMKTKLQVELSAMNE